METLESQYWLFVDSKTRVVSRRLSQIAAEDFIKNLRNVNIENWWAWNPCFRDWLPLKNIVDLREGKVRMLIQLAQPAPSQSHPIQEEYDERKETTRIPEEYSEVRNFLREEAADDVKDFHGDELTFSRPPKPPNLNFGSDRRRSHRVDKRVEVLVACRGKSFRTHTVNISMTGVMLDKAVPFELMGGPFEIVFIFQGPQGKKQLAFQGKVTGDYQDRRRLVFGDITSQSQKMLEDLIAA